MSRQNEMTFVAALGVEGSGHHALRALLRPWLKRLDVDDECRYSGENWFDAALDVGRIRPWQLVRSRKMRRDDPDRERNARALLDRSLGKSQHAYLFFSASLPFGRETIQRSFNIPKFPAVLRSVEAWGKSKTVILKRNPLDSCRTTLRRQFDVDVDVACALHRQAVLEHRQQIEELKADRRDTFLLEFDNLVNHPLDTSRQLAEWMGLSEQDFETIGVRPSQNGLLSQDKEARMKLLLDGIAESRSDR
mgnify:CR=1 FL=1